VPPAWAQAFVVAGLLTLVGTPFLRRIALATDFVDHPTAAHKSHTKVTPYLGGVGLIVALLVGLLFTSRLTPATAVIALGGALIGCLGLLDDHRTMGPILRFAVEVAVACVALAAGLRVHATDIPAIDGMITIVWIVGVTNAVNLLDNMDGLAAGVSAAAATAIFAIAILGEQAVTATLAAALVGACLGFLAHNKRPASIFMGDSGSLFLGFVLAIATIEVNPALQPPTSFAVPLMLLALPVLDTATVAICRLRRGRSVALGGRDHLSHRLVARGLPPGAAVAVLVGTEAAVGLLATLAGRDVVSLTAAFLATATVLTTLSLWTVRADVYAEQVVGLPRLLKVSVLGGLGVVVLAAAPAVVALARAHAPGIEGARAASRGLSAVTAGDLPGASAQFDQAAADLRRAHAILHAPGTSFGLAIPVLRANLATARAVAGAAKTVAGSGSDLSAIALASDIPLAPGADPVAATGRLAPALDASASVLQRAVATVSGYDRPYLWPGLGSTVGLLRSSLRATAEEASRAADLVRLLPSMLGSAGPRHYFVAIQDNAELRGAGGVVRYWGEIEAVGGRLSLVRFGNIDELNKAGSGKVLQTVPEFLDRYRDFDVAGTWQNVNVSPDFSVTGRVIADLYPQSGGRAVDGVIAIDLPGLAALIGLAGPVKVDGWAEPLTAANLVETFLQRSYERFPVPADRQAFVARAVEAAIRAVASADLGDPGRVGMALGSAAAKGHFLLYATRSEEQLLARRLSAAGEIVMPTGDSLMVVNQNVSGNAIDAYLRRAVRYDIVLDPGPRTAKLTGRVDVTLRNEAPSSGLSPTVIGPVDDRFVAGENRTYLSVYSPLSLVGSTLEGRPTDMGADPELGRLAYSTIVSLPSHQSRTVGIGLRGRVPLGTDSWYQLDVLQQTSLAPQDTQIAVSVPKGWRIVEARGLRIDDDRHASIDLLAEVTTGVAVRLQRTPWARLWARD
jgi:UDP-GlcNAc:undecaprenyl-phosphate GlcNAc-1-phosphate transferase